MDAWCFRLGISAIRLPSKVIFLSGQDRSAAEGKWPLLGEKHCYGKKQNTKNMVNLFITINYQIRRKQCIWNDSTWISRGNRSGGLQLVYRLQINQWRKGNGASQRLRYLEWINPILISLWFVSSPRGPLCGKGQGGRLCFYIDEKTERVATQFAGVDYWSACVAVS